MSRSISFDPAAEYYDRTRTLPPELHARVTSLLADELRGRGRCLEVGIGTGRISLPLRQAGVELVGVDLSLSMLQRLLAKTRTLPAAQADAVQLPFPDQVFGGAFACHVLHLIPDWRRAVAEMVRVTRPGGVVLIDRGGGPDAWRELRRRFFAEAGQDVWRLGLDRVEELDAELAAVGARRRLLEPLEWREQEPVGPRIDRLEEGIYAACWGLDPAVLPAAAAATRVWAVERYGSLEAELEVSHTIQWRAYDLP